MLKKRYFILFLAVLSFFMLAGCSNAEAAKKNGKTDNIADNGPAMKIYMPSSVAESNDGVLKLTATKGFETQAKKLFDKNTTDNVEFERDASVTLDMGREILLSGVGYYVGAVDKENGNNCIGTRFFASKDNKNYTEIAVIENSEPPENGRYELNFGGFGSYRYFRVNIPAKSNITEIEWLETEGFLSEKDTEDKVTLSLSGYDVKRDVDATVFGIVYGKNGVMKKITAKKMKFFADKETDFNVTLSGIKAEDGDVYRIVLFDENGASPIAAPLVYCINGASERLQTAAVFGNDMILQADKPALIYGKAQRGASVTVRLESDMGGGVERTASVDADGKWQINIGSFSAGGSYTMTIKDGQDIIKYKNITFGDIWLCTGQSNMDYYMMGGGDTAAELDNPQNIENKDIRILNYWDKGINGAAKPVDNPPSDGVCWHTASADTVSYCSAVGYYFARGLQEKTGKPVGIINVAVGDTEINRWLPQGLKCGSFVSTSGSLYNNRIYPLSKINIAGVILYQGEADQYRTHLSAEKYSDAMAGLVDNYRKVWGTELPFYWAQLARYKVDESDIREGQRMALSKVSVKKNTGMIVLNDIVGNYEGGSGSCRDDIHPHDKKTVADRFLRYALRDCHGEEIDVSGPKFKEAKRNGYKLIVSFECEGGLTVLPQERYADKQTDERIERKKINTAVPMEFEIAGSDKKFKAANAVIDGDSVILTSSEVSAPIYVRYAWGAYPEMPNLTDASGLPTETFTTEFKTAGK